MAENNTTVDILNDLKPNSDKYKERTKTESEKNLERIVTGNVSVKKKNDIQKFAETFVKEDLHTVKSYIWTEVLLPAFKAVISDSVNMMLYGETSRNRKQLINEHRRFHIIAVTIDRMIAGNLITFVVRHDTSLMT